MEEIFVDIDGTDGCYQISNYGRVKNVRFNRIINGTPKGKYGHIQVSLGRKYFYEYIHRLVAQAFIPNPDNKPEIDHIDGDPTNNCVTNLKWATRKENLNNPITIARFKQSNKGKHKGRHIMLCSDGLRHWVN